LLKTIYDCEEFAGMHLHFINYVDILYHSTIVRVDYFVIWLLYESIISKGCSNTNWK